MRGVAESCISKTCHWTVILNHAFQSCHFDQLKESCLAEGKIAPGVFIYLMRQNRHCLNNAKILVIGNDILKTSESTQKNY